LVRLQIECSLHRAATFACKFPPLDFLAHSPTHCSLGASLEVAPINPEVVENREAKNQHKGIGAKDLKSINLMD
jgi:hypothetical protein